MDGDLRRRYRSVLCAGVQPSKKIPMVRSFREWWNFCRFVFGELLRIGEKSRMDFCVDALNEAEGGFAIASHAALEGQIGKVFMTEDFCFFFAKLEDFPDEF